MERVGGGEGGTVLKHRQQLDDYLLHVLTTNAVNPPPVKHLLFFSIEFCSLYSTFKCYHLLRRLKENLRKFNVGSEGFKK